MSEYAAPRDLPMSDHPCRLCGDRPLLKALTLAEAPRNVQRLLQAHERDSDRAISLTVCQCKRCGFVQLPPLLDDEYYDDYMMVATHSAQMQSFQADQARDFVTRFGLTGKSVVEIGCGDGNYLGNLADAGAVVSGIEPSRVTRELAINKGHAVEAGYVTATRRLQGAPFDGFVTRQVMEHVPDIHDVLTGIRRNLKAGAVGLVEVPSLEKAIADRRFYDFFSDHVNYFSFATLRMALEMNGFEVLEVRQDMFDEYNTAIVRNPQEVSLEGIQRAIETLGSDFARFIGEYRTQGKKVAIWGAGGKGLSVLASAGIRDVDLLVDSDRNKQGRYTPVSHLKVEAPSALVGAGIDAVIITAMAYVHEIRRTLADDYGFNGVVATLGEELVVD